MPGEPIPTGLADACCNSYASPSMKKNLSQLEIRTVTGASPAVDVHRGFFFTVDNRRALT